LNVSNRKITIVITMVTPTNAAHCMSRFDLSAPAWKPWIVAPMNRGKLRRWIACQIRLGSRRIIHDVIWIASIR
jgi:hypothetical protein